MPATDLRLLDPTGERFGIPTYPWGAQLAPGHLLTRRQLRDLDRSIGGQEPAAQLLAPRCGGGFSVAFLYDIALSKPKRTVTRAVLDSVAGALAARRTCGECGRDTGYDLGRRRGRVCMDCDPIAWGVPA
jgi:hypothetical protein